MNTYLKQISWKVALALALVCLIRPLLSIAGVFEDIKPVGPLVATALIALTWIVVAIKMKLQNPIATLGAAGGLYGLLVILLPFVVFLTLPEKNPEMPTVPGAVAVTVMNILWGTVLGFVATLLKRLVRS